MSDSLPVSSAVSSQPSSRLELLPRFAVGALNDHRLVSIADQFIVSATNFLTGVIVGRAAGEEALGAYALAFSVMLLVLCVQQSLICLPYTIRVSNCDDDENHRLTGSAISQSAMMYGALIVALLLGLAATVTQLDRALSLLIAALAITLPFALLRDFSRRISFAQFSPWAALVIDAVVFTLQLALLLLLWQFDVLSAATAYLAIGAACAIAALCWVWQRRFDLTFSRRDAFSDLRTNWPLGRWVFGSQMLTVLNAYLIFWLAAAKLGILASGILAACNVIIQLSNPILLGTYNMLAPRLAAANATEGSHEVARVARRTTLFLAVVMSTFTVLAYFFGEAVVRLLYGKDYAIPEVALICGLLGLAEIASAVGGPADQALWVKHRPALSFWTGAAGLFVTLSTALSLIPVWGLMGVVTALVAGNSIAAALRWTLLPLLVRAVPEERR